MNPVMIDTYRALAGVLGSDKIGDDIKAKAKEIMVNIMKVMEKSTELEMKTLNDFSAKMSGIIS